MKAIKIMLLSIFLVSAFFVTAYSGGGSCRSDQNGPGMDVDSEVYYIPSGTNYNWRLIIEGNNEIDNSYVSSYACIIGPASPIFLQYKQQGADYYHFDAQNSGYTSNGSYTYLYTGAEVGSDNDNGSGSSGYASVTW